MRRAGTVLTIKNKNKNKKVWMFIVICPITYWRLFGGEFTMVWRMVILMWWMALIEFLAMCIGVLMKKHRAFVYAFCFSRIIDEEVPIFWFFGAVIEVSTIVGRGVRKYEF